MEGRGERQEGRKKTPRLEEKCWTTQPDVMKAADPGDATQFQPPAAPRCRRRRNRRGRGMRASAAPPAGGPRPHGTSGEAGRGGARRRDGARDPGALPPPILTFVGVGRGWHYTDPSPNPSWRGGHQANPSTPNRKLETWGGGGEGRTFGFSHSVPTFTPMSLSQSFPEKSLESRKEPKLGDQLLSLVGGGPSVRFCDTRKKRVPSPAPSRLKWSQPRTGAGARAVRVARRGRSERLAGRGAPRPGLQVPPRSQPAAPPEPPAPILMSLMTLETKPL